jgi:hypothetical protein
VSRRLFLARSLAVTAGAVAVGTAGTGAVLANSAPVVRRVPVAIAGLDPALVGYRIVTFSDAHLSTTYGGRRFERVVETVNAQRPDIVAVVGDLVDGEVSDLREEVAPLADLVSQQGVYFVTGNHEYLVDTDAWLRHLPTLGIDVLRNERVALGRGRATFDLAGIDDRTAARSGVPGHGADLDAALDSRDDAAPLVLLAHQPWMVEQAHRRRGSAAVRAHPRRAAVALRRRHPARPARRRGPVPARRHTALRHRRRRLLGSADADRRPPGGHRHRAHPCPSPTVTV